MAVPIWRGKVAGGRLHLDRRAEFDAYAQSLDGKRFELVLRREVQRRTPAQNRKLHVALKILGNHLGYTLQEIKGIMKWEYGITSTADQSVEESSEFIEFVLRRAAELRCPIDVENIEP